MLNTNHTSPKNVYTSFEHKMIPSGLENKPKKRNMHISINRGPTPSFQLSKMTNIATCYKETSEKIKGKNDQAAKKVAKNLIEKNKKQDKGTGYLNALHSMRNLDEGNNMNRLIASRESVNIPNRNLTNYNTNMSGSININKTNNNSSINSSYFPKNTITTSQLNDSKSNISKVHITFTHRNYNDSVNLNSNASNANNSLYDYRVNSKGAEQKYNTANTNSNTNAFINIPTGANYNSNNTNSLKGSTSTNILSSSGNFKNSNVNNSVSMSSNSQIRKNKPSNTLSNGNTTANKNNVLQVGNINQSQGQGVSALNGINGLSSFSNKYQSNNSGSNNSKKIQFLSLRNKSASNNTNGNVLINNREDGSKDRLVINTNISDKVVSSNVNVSNPTYGNSNIMKNSYTRKNSLNMSTNKLQGNKVSTTYQSSANSYISNLIKPNTSNPNMIVNKNHLIASLNSINTVNTVNSGNIGSTGNAISSNNNFHSTNSNINNNLNYTTQNNYTSNNTDLGQYTQPAIELSSSLKPSDMEEVRNYVKMNKVRSGSLLHNSSHIKNLSHLISGVGVGINPYKSRHTKRNSSCNNANINNASNQNTQGLVGSLNLIKKERNFSRDRLLGVKSMDQITCSEIMNLNLKRNNQVNNNEVLNGTYDHNNYNSHTNTTNNNYINSTTGNNTSTVGNAAIQNFKKYIKNNKSLSLIGIKEKYKELLKNKSIPASLMIKSFKLSTDFTKGNKIYTENENQNVIHHQGEVNNLDTKFYDKDTKEKVVNNINEDKNRIKELDDNIDDLVLSSRDDNRNNINSQLTGNDSKNIPKIKNILVNKNIYISSNPNNSSSTSSAKVNPNNGNVINTNLQEGVNNSGVNQNRPNTTKNKMILPFSKNSKDLQMQNLKFLIQDNCKNGTGGGNTNNNTSNGNSMHFNNLNNLTNHPNSMRGPPKASRSLKNPKILSMDATNLNMNVPEETIITNNVNKLLNSNSIILEEEPETIKKHPNPEPQYDDNLNKEEEDDFDDLNSIIKHIKFENINIYKENIFSQNNFLYTNFEDKFSNEFDAVLLPNFLRRISSSTFNKNKTSSQHKDKSVSTQDTSSKKTVSPYTSNSLKKVCDDYDAEKVNLFNVHLSKLK